MKMSREEQERILAKVEAMTKKAKKEFDRSMKKIDKISKNNEQLDAQLREIWKDFNREFGTNFHM